MKKLSAEEGKEIEPLKKGKYNWLYKELMLLQQGEVILIRFTDWKTKNNPYKTIKIAAKNLKRTFDYGLNPDGSGWVVKRVS
ncbi:MAG: hypothetical protein AB7G44_00185 [Bacteroidia bacterium]